ncbi:hypothetical protein [Thalassolituus alkanivorans]|uniref:hypothetical protein n=1 Tax=Thalassolituus alkanivorans TaxID=2881055 RepID=UPI001E4FB9C8|nr:hypothetical protein [Thalassolituus alkanivorans]MCB2386784.1 hypothetical protein [Thalassolituus alkanivorans]MCB2423541.1 hypothetical protein [Thalassolituus alkanivorans]
MLFILIGSFLLIAGLLSINFEGLTQSLKEQDKAQWTKLGSPEGSSFIDLGKTLGMFSWVLNQGYESSESPEVKERGRSDFKKAIIARRLLLSGSSLLIIGFFAALTGV